MLKNNHAIIILLLALVLMPSINAAETTPPPSSLVQTQIIAEGIKTRTELQKYIDNVVVVEEGKIQTIILPYIDENFKRFDDNMHALFLKFMVQFAILMFAVIIFANAVWYLIRRTIENIGRKFTKKVKYDPMLHVDSRLTKEFKAKTSKKDETIVPQTSSGEERQRPIPSMKKVEELLKEKHEKEDAERQQQ